MNRTTDKSTSRRDFLTRTGIILTSATVLLPAAGLAHAQETTRVHQIEDVTPSEDLMREHGVLRRILLIYENIEDRINRRKEFPPEVLARSAGLIRTFVEDYHEQLEEQYLFPRFEKAGKLVELVHVLKEQHRAGRGLTQSIKGTANPASLKEAGKRKELAKNIHLFISMYRPHAAREDTILFPTFHSIVSPRELDSLGDAFEEKEDQLFGEDGFEKMVGQVAELEKALGIYELAQFTPPK